MPCVAPLQAGARSLVVTLWEINDLATAEIMEAFYEIRDTGADKAEALGKAIAQVRATKERSHPYYWGAFVLTGAW
jgi:CHAT domain-containing protein